MIVIRPAIPEDSADLFAWRNDPQTREASVHQALISWDEHQEWFRKSLTNPSRFVYIAEIQEGEGSAAPVGTCRFDLRDRSDGAEISLNLNPGYRGLGLAVPILRAAIDVFFEEGDGPADLFARIRPSNAASVRCFGAAGFLLEGADDEEGFDRYRRPVGGV